MTWAQIDDRLDEHPKFLAAGWRLEHFGMYVCVLTYCSRYLTDGQVPRSAVDRMGGGDKKSNRRVARQLVEKGFWREDGDYFEVVGYLDHNASKSQVMDRISLKSSAKSASGRLGGVKSGEARRSKPPKQDEAKVKQVDEAERSPLLSSPLLSSPIKKEEEDIVDPKYQEVLVHEHYLSLHEKHFGRKGVQPKLTGDRLKKLQARLKDGYSVEQLCQACTGLFLSPHHLGQNDRGEKYLDLFNALKEPHLVDKFIALAEAKKPEPSPNKFVPYPEIPEDQRPTKEQRDAGMKILEQVISNYGNGGQ